jgi:hypothetical protein
MLRTVEKKRLPRYRGAANTRVYYTICILQVHVVCTPMYITIVCTYTVYYLRMTSTIVYLRVSFLIDCK